MTVLVVLALAVLVAHRPRLRRDLPLRSPSTTGALGGAVGRWLAPRLEAADVDLAPEVVARRWLLAGLGAVVAATIQAGAVLGLLAAAMVGLGPVVGLRLADQRGVARLERELPGLLEAVARAVRSGATVPQALAEASAGPSTAARELRAVLDEVDRGRPLVEGLDGWAERRALPAVRLVVGALAVALASGGSAARGVDGVAATLRERLEVDREVRALATQARVSALVVTLAPLGFAALGMLGDERTAEFLLRTRAGLACLVLGLALDGLGAWWMTRIAGRAA